MMVVYISGQISGLDLTEAKRKFQKSEDFLKSLGMTPVNPMKNGLPESASWEYHMSTDIEMLFGCNAIYMQSEWINSKGARIEKYIAEQCGYMILFESDIQRKENESIHRLKCAIESVTGLKFEHYTTCSKRRDLYFARLIFSYHCVSCFKMSIEDVAPMINRKLTQINRTANSYKNEISVNPKFRAIAERVNNLLNNNVSE